jgi:hypothetical protein
LPYSKAWSSNANLPNLKLHSQRFIHHATNE